MRFFSFCTAALSLFAGLVAADENPIIFPGVGSQVTAGQTYTITWKPTTTGTSITLALRYGPQRNLVAASVIAVAVENNGAATWTVPIGIGNGQWTIQIIDSAGNINYSPMFQVSGGSGSQGVASVTSTLVASTATNTPTITGTNLLVTATGKATSTKSVSSITGAVAGTPSGGAAQVAGHGGIAAVIGLGALAMLA